MSIRTGLLLRVVLAFVLIASSLAAEERCVSQETPRQCLRRLIAARAYETAQATLATVTTAPSSAASPVRSAVKDFLSVASAHLAGSSVKDSGQSLTLDYNLPGRVFGASRQINLEVTLADPVLSPAAAAEASSDPVGTALLKDALRRGDDVAVSLAYNPTTQYFGRGIVPHRALLDSMLFAFVSSAGLATASVPAAAFDTPFVQIAPDAAARMTAMAEFEAASIAILPGAAGRLTADLTRLANNQPQLFASVWDHYRKPGVGPKERGYRVTWEIGTDNINSFRRNGGRDCEAQGTCLAAFNDYASRTAANHYSGRFAFAIEYAVTEANVPGLRAAAVTQLAGRKLTWFAVYGRDITSFISGRQGRIDLALTSDGKHTTQNVSSLGALFARTGPDAYVAQTQLLPPSWTRFSAAATVTQPIGGQWSAFISPVWIDRVEWLPGLFYPTASPVLPIGKPFSRNERGIQIQFGFRYQGPSLSKLAPSSSRECCCK